LVEARIDVTFGLGEEVGFFGKPWISRSVGAARDARLSYSFSEDDNKRSRLWISNMTVKRPISDLGNGRGGDAGIFAFIGRE